MAMNLLSHELPGSMSYATRISPTDIRNYARVRGWMPVPEVIPDRLYVLNHPALNYRD